MDIVWTNTITHGGTVRISLLKSQGDPNPVILKDKIDYQKPDPTQPNNGQGLLFVVLPPAVAPGPPAAPATPRKRRSISI